MSASAATASIEASWKPCAANMRLAASSIVCSRSARGTRWRVEEGIQAEVSRIYFCVTLLVGKEPGQRFRRRALRPQDGENEPRDRRSADGEVPGRGAALAGVRDAG